MTDFRLHPLYPKIDEILKSKLTHGKNKLSYGKPISEDQLLLILHQFVSTLRRYGTCFFGSLNPGVPLGLNLRTPSYLTTKICIDYLLKHEVIELMVE